MLKWEIICSQEQGSIDAMSPLVEQLLDCTPHPYAEHSRRGIDCLAVFFGLDHT